jgi:uncharacterized integral membrane protein
MQYSLLLALVFLVGIAVFVFQNTSVVTVNFLNWGSPDIPLAVVVLIATCIGALTTFLLNSVRYFKLAKKIKELTTANKELLKELNELKVAGVANKDEQNFIETSAERE